MWDGTAAEIYITNTQEGFWFNLKRSLSVVPHGKFISVRIYSEINISLLLKEPQHKDCSTLNKNPNQFNALIYFQLETKDSWMF